MRGLPLYFFLFSALSRAAELTGTITDPNGQPVAGATIRVFRRDGAVRTGTADASGRYRISDLPAGEYLVEATSRGLTSTAASVINIDPNAAASADLRLEIARVVERVTVTAENAPLTLDETAKALSVVDRTEIHNRQVFSLAEALRLTPGLRVQQLGGPGTFTRIQVRGLRASDTAVVIDGFRFRDVGSTQGDATSFLSDILMVNSDRIEVLRGSGSSLYGTNAMGGVLQLVTSQGGGPFHGEVVAEGGGLGLARGFARAGGSLGRNQPFRFSGGVGHLNVTRGVDGDDRARNTSGQGWAQYVFSNSGALSARYFASDVFLGINNSPAAAPLAQLPAVNPVPGIPGVTFLLPANDPDRRRVSHFHSTMVQYQQSLGTWASLRAGYQALLTNRFDINGPGGTGFQPGFRTSSAFGGRIDTALARVDLVRWRRNLLTAGYEFEREVFRNPAVDENPDPARRVNANATGEQSSQAVFIQDQLRLLSDRLLISASGRFQRFDLAQPVFSGGTPVYQGVRVTSPPDAYTGDVAIAYLLPATSTKLRAHAGNAYRAPALYERFGTFFFGGTFSALGDPRLSPERSLAVDAGLDQYFAANRVRLSATWFYTRLQSVITFGNLRNDPFNRFSGYLNAGGGLARGLEFSAEAKPWRGLTLMPAYTYTNADERTPFLTDGSIRAIRVFPHAFQLVALQNIGRRANISFDLLAASDYISGSFFVGGGSRPFLFEGPRQAGLAASYTFPLTDRLGLQAYGRVYNVFNQTYFEDGFPNPKAWGVGGFKLIF